MTITYRLREANSYLYLHPESAFSGSPNAGLYKAFNDGGVECEVGEFLYSMVRVLKPTHVLETGTHLGIGACYLGLGLKDNGFGLLETFEFLEHIYAVGKSNIEKTGLSDYVRASLLDVKDFVPQNNYQLILLDTEPSTRFSEFLKFFDYLDEGGFIFIHDLPRTFCQGNINSDHPEIPSWPFGDIPLEMKNLISEKKVSVFHFPTPRGLVGFYKRHVNDYSE